MLHRHDWTAHDHIFRWHSINDFPFPHWRFPSIPQILLAFVSIILLWHDIFIVRDAAFLCFWHWIVLLIAVGRLCNIVYIFAANTISTDKMLFLCATIGYSDAPTFISLGDFGLGISPLPIIWNTAIVHSRLPIEIEQVRILRKIINIVVLLLIIGICIVGIHGLLLLWGLEATYLGRGEALLLMVPLFVILVTWTSWTRWTASTSVVEFFLLRWIVLLFGGQVCIDLLLLYSYHFLFFS